MMLNKLEKAIQDVVFIPNEWLPVQFRNEKDGGRTLSELEALCDNRDEVEQQRKKDEAKKRNVEIYRSQVKEIRDKYGKFVDIDGPLDYSAGETDELQLHRNQMALVNGMVNGGLISAEDLDE